MHLAACFGQSGAGAALRVLDVGLGSGQAGEAGGQVLVEAGQVLAEELRGCPGQGR